MKKKPTNCVSKNSIVWITGASSGIGAALAKEMAKRGVHLILSGRRIQALLNVQNDCQKLGAGDILVLPFEATDFDQLTSIVTTAEGWKGGIDLLINNAGVSQRSLIINTDMDVYRKIMDIDYFAPVQLTMLVLPGMIERGGGMIAVTSSLAGKMGSKLRSGYCSAKHALQGFFESLRAEHYQDNIRVSLILPGYVKSNVSVSALKGDGSRHGVMDKGQSKAITAEEAAKKIIAQLEKGREEIYVGSGIEMIAPLLKRFFPKLLSQILRNQKLPSEAQFYDRI